MQDDRVLIHPATDRSSIDYLDRYTPRGYPLEIRQKCLDQARESAFEKLNAVLGLITTQ
jgi:aromatic ring-cleaving dioxygenase